MVLNSALTFSYLATLAHLAGPTFFLSIASVLSPHAKQLYLPLLALQGSPLLLQLLYVRFLPVLTKALTLLHDDPAYPTPSSFHIPIIVVVVTTIREFCGSSVVVWKAIIAIL